MKKIIIKHLTGSKSNQTEMFELPLDNLVFGRDHYCNVKFDPDKDAYVSASHCIISIKNGQYFLADLGSSNGTYLNGQLLGNKQKLQAAPAQLKAGDTVQLGGSQGVSFAFDLDPRPMPQTKIIGKETQITGHDDKNTLPPAKAPDQEAIHDKKRPKFSLKFDKKMVNIAAALTGIAMLSSYFYLQQRPNSPSIGTNVPSVTAISPADIYNQYANSTVLIEMGWKLIDVASGKQVFQKLGCITERGQCKSDDMPMYIAIGGEVEPVLVFDNGIPIGSSGSGSGFVVSETGHILTNRHIASPWQMSQTVDFRFPGILLVCNNEDCTEPKLTILQNDPSNPYIATLRKWVPIKAKTLNKKPLHGKSIEGRFDYLDVTFPNTNMRIPAHVANNAGKGDVTLIKIDLVKKLQPIPMDAGYAISPGNEITVLGYPAVSPDHVRKDENGGWLTIPGVTITSGIVGRVLADVDNSETSNEHSEINDSYQLTVNATGPGNSGGPVFNNKGQAIGIFSAKSIDNTGTAVTFAVPIKYGLELTK